MKAVDAATTAATTYDVAKVERCYKSHQTYFAEARSGTLLGCDVSKHLQASDYEPYTGTTILETIKTFGPGSLYMECDGITRFRFSSGASKTTSAEHITLTHQGWKFGNWTKACATKTVHRPPCEIPEAFCNSLWDSYRSEAKTFSGNDTFQIGPQMPVWPCAYMETNCHINLESEVMMLYWAPQLVSRDICASDGILVGKTLGSLSSAPVMTLTEVTLAGLDLYPRSYIEENTTFTWRNPILESTVITGSWELTSGTIYLAHRSIISYGLYQTEMGYISTEQLATPRNSVIREAGIISMQAEDVRSLRPVVFTSSDAVQEAREVANGQWRPAPGQLLPRESIIYETKPFNFGHLKNPVPASVYFDVRADCWGAQVHCATITDDSYRPRLRIRGHVWRSILGDNIGCYFDPELNDPPIALSIIEHQDLRPTFVKPAPFKPTGPSAVDEIGWHPPATLQPGFRPLAQQNARPTAISNSQQRWEEILGLDGKGNGRGGLGTEDDSLRTASPNHWAQEDGRPAQDFHFPSAEHHSSDNINRGTSTLRNPKDRDGQGEDAKENGPSKSSESDSKAGKRAKNGKDRLTSGPWYLLLFFLISVVFMNP